MSESNSSLPSVEELDDIQGRLNTIAETLKQIKEMEAEIGNADDYKDLADRLGGIEQTMRNVIELEPQMPADE